MVFGAAGSLLGEQLLLSDVRFRDMRLAAIQLQASWDKDRFERGTRRWLDLSGGDNLLRGYYTLPLDGEPHFFVEYRADPTLGEVIRRHRGAMPIERVVRLAAQLAGALRYTHSRDWIHGQIRPEAIQVDEDDTLRLGCFDLGMPLLVRDSERQPYFAPERFANEDAEATTAEDVYGFGIVLHEMLAGRPPFEARAKQRREWKRKLEVKGTFAMLRSFLPFGGRQAPNPTPELLELLGLPRVGAEQRLTLMRLLHETVPPLLLDRSPETPPALQDLLEACLAKRPDKRPDFEAIHTRLLQIAHEGGATLEPHSWQVQTTEARTNNRAACHAEMGQIGRATRILDKWLKRHPTAVFPWVNRKILAIHEDPAQLVSALEEFEREIRPRSTELLHHDARMSEVLEFLTRRLLSLDGAVDSLCWGPEGALLAGDFSGGLRLWRVGAGGGTQGLPSWVGGGADAVALDPKGDLALVQNDRRIAVIDVLTGSPRWTKEFDAPPASAVMSTKGQWTLVSVPGQVLFFDTATGQLAQWLNVGGKPIEHLRFSRSDEWIALARGGAVIVLNLEDRANRRRLQGFETPIRDLCFTADDKGLVIAHGSKAAGLFDVRTGGCLRRFRGHEGEVRCLALDPAGQRLATGGVDGTVRLFHVRTGSEIRAVGGFRGTVQALGFSRDGRQVLAGADSGLARVCDVDPRLPPLFVVPEGKSALSDRVHRNVRENTLILHDRGSSAGLVVSVLDANVDWLHPYEEPVTTVAFSADGTQVLAGLPHSAHVSRIAGRVVHLDTTQVHHDCEIFDLAFSPDGTRLVAGTGRGPLEERASASSTAPTACLEVIGAAEPTRYYIGEAGLTIGRGKHRDAVLTDAGVSRQHCTIRFEGDRFVLYDDGSANGIYVNGVKLRESQLADGDELLIGESMLRFNLVGPDGDEATTMLLVLQSESETASTGWTEISHVEHEESGLRASNIALIWEIQTRRVLQKLTGHEGPVRAVRYADDGSVVVTASEDGTVAMWEPNSGRCIRQYVPEPGASDPGGATSLALHPEGRWVLAGFEDGSARIWSRETGREVRLFAGHAREIGAVAFSHDGRRVLTGSRDGTACLWDCRNGRRVGRLSAHTGAVTEVGFTADSRILLTGSEDGTARLWSRFTLQELHTVEIKARGVNAVKFSPDGRMLLAGGADGSLQTWLVRWFWVFLSDALDLVEKALANPDAPSTVWPRRKGDDDLDFWLDVWSDIRRCSHTAGPQDEARLAKVRTRILYTLLGCVREQAGASASVPKGLGTWAETVAVDDKADLTNALYAIKLVDPRLAADLRKQLTS